VGGKGGGNVNVNLGGTTRVESANTLDIIGLDDIDLRTEVTLPQPLELQTESNSRTELAITEPIRSEGKNEVALDIRPLTADLCLNVSFGRLPPTCIRQPYQNHFGITLFGMEILGFNLAGESQMIIDDLPSRPHIAWGGEQAAQLPTHGNVSPQHEPSEGLRIRVG
jgi:hypothetical protein